MENWFKIARESVLKWSTELMQNWSEFEAKWNQIGFKNYLESIQHWSRIDAKLIWFKINLRLRQSWFKIDPK